jgi:hypothetical protein
MGGVYQMGDEHEHQAGADPDRREQQDNHPARHRV